MRQEQALKFLCDEQLGKLARWLRIIGQDAFFKNRLGDKELIELAEKETRIVLTRDHKIVKLLSKKGLAYYFLTENYPALQLREVVERFQDKIRIRVFSRCVECNLALEQVLKEDVKDLVPPFVYKHQSQFKRCPGCKKIFWSATHKSQVELQLKSVLGEIYDKISEEVWNPIEQKG